MVLFSLTYIHTTTTSNNITIYTHCHLNLPPYPPTHPPSNKIYDFRSSCLTNNCVPKIDRLKNKELNTAIITTTTSTKKQSQRRDA